MQYIRQLKMVGIGILAFVLLMIGVLEVKAEGDTTVDFVLVLDCSGSMNSSDAEMMSVEAAKLFVDLVPIENARIGIVGFGPNWGDTSYVYEKNGKVRDLTVYDGTHAIQAYSLSSVEESDKQDIKDIITNIMSSRQGESYTTVGYALQAAMDMLAQNNTPANQACIILMSDGRLTDTVPEEDLYDADGVRQSYSLDGALTQAAESGWPVYCVELAFDANLENQINKWLVPTGTYQMNRIAATTGGEKVTAESESQMIELFTGIFQRFIKGSDDSNSGDDRYVAEITDGYVTDQINVDTMTAEMDIIIEGQELEAGKTLPDVVTSIEITSPDGSKDTYTGTDSSESRFITFENGYILAKLVQPQMGEWKVTVYGTEGVSIQFTKIAMHELNLVLRTEQKDTIAQGDAVQFSANFYYNDNAMSVGTFYTDYSAYLENVETHEKLVEMTGEENRYSVKYAFKEVGVFQVRAVVESGVFRNDRKVSDTITVVVEASETKADSQSEEQTQATEQTQTSVDESASIDGAENSGDKKMGLSKIILIVLAAAVAGILLKAKFGSKQIPGTWEVTINGQFKRNSMRLGSKVKSKYTIDEILSGFGLPGSTGVSKIVLKKSGSKVSLSGLDNVSSLKRNGTAVRADERVTKIDLSSKGSSAEFSVGTDTIRIKRES